MQGSISQSYFLFDSVKFSTARKIYYQLTDKGVKMNNLCVHDDEEDEEIAAILRMSDDCCHNHDHKENDDKDKDANLFSSGFFGSKSPMEPDGEVL